MCAYMSKNTRFIHLSIIVFNMWRSFTLNKNIQTNPYLPERLRKRVHLNLPLIHNTFYFALDVGGTKIWM